ncbi:MAG: hypothetical protein WBX01_10955 [Nitrososphaeraceae archaeon]
MVDFHRLTIPIIVILIVGGTISFFLAYGFYPEKHVNVKVDEKCYELLDNALTKYNRLQAERDLLVLKLQTNAIESPDAIVPVIFSGTREEIDNLISDYNIKINNSQRLEAGNNHIDKYIIEATTSKQNLRSVVKDLTAKDFDPLRRTIFGSLGLQSNSYITEEEGKRISSYSKYFMSNGIRQIVDDGSDIEGHYDGVKQAECRTEIQY